MKSAIAFSALAAATLVSAQIPDGCTGDFQGTFEYNPIPVDGTKSSDTPTPYEHTTCTAQPYTNLKGGVLTDQCQRTGEIVSNNQLQYDLHLQSGALNTAGFSVCKNNTLAVAGSTIFYHCLSGNFYNLYDATIGAQCSPVYIQVIPCDAPSDAGSDCPAGTPSSPPSVTSSPSASTTLATSSSSTKSSTSSPAAVTSAAASSAPAAVVTLSMPYSAPSSNATIIATATGTGVAPGSTGTATTSPIAAFHGGAANLAMGGKLLVSAVGIAALAFLA